MNFSLRSFALILFAFSVSSAYGQKALSTQENVVVTMDMQGVLELRMLTQPQVDFVFNSVHSYQTGITRSNATVLEVNSTVPWDLYVQPGSQYWEQMNTYSSGNGGQNLLPSEILELQCQQANRSQEAANFNNFIGLTSNFGTNTASGTPNAFTQYLSGQFGAIVNPLIRSQPEVQSSAAVNSRFAINYRIKPGIPANFPNLSKQYPAVAESSNLITGGYAQPGYYQMEVVYSLVEDL